MQIEILLQSWERITVPWCDAAILRNWQQTYLQEVYALIAAFPNATIFLRTQAISSAIFLGNHRCHKPMNDFIIHVVHSFQQVEKEQNSKFKQETSTNFNGIDNSSNNSDSDNRNNNRETTVVPVVRLIDMHGLFAAPNDNGIDHFSPDNVHLTVEGFRVYRSFVYKVLNDHYLL